MINRCLIGVRQKIIVVMNKIAVKICMNLNNVSDVKTAEFIFFQKKAVRKFYHNINLPDFTLVFPETNLVLIHLSLLIYLMIFL